MGPAGDKTLSSFHPETSSPLVGEGGGEGDDEGEGIHWVSGWKLSNSLERWESKNPCCLSLQAGAEDFNGGLVELFGENIRIQAIFIFNEGASPSQLPGDNHLRSLEKDQIPFLHLLAVPFDSV